MTLFIRVYDAPQPGGSKKGFVNPKTGRVIILEDAKRNKPWRQSVKAAALDAIAKASAWSMPDGSVKLTITFYMLRPKGHYGTGRNAGMLKQTAPRFPTTKPDLTKLVRSTEDALTGIVWHDDAQIVTQVLFKRYADEDSPVGAEMWIETAPTR
ncbi:MAG: RusA family crossover junction endodeoxyribonuclease [bacterium]